MKWILLFCLMSSVGFASYQGYFSPADDLDEVVQSELARAKRSVDIAIYTFRSKPVRSILEKLLREGVKVRILIRPANRERTIGFVQPLNDLGAEIRYVMKTNHHKYAIIDGERLLNSSANFNDSRLQKSYDENLFVCTSCRKLLREFQSEFDYLFMYSNPLIDGPAHRFVEDSRRFVDGAVALFTSFNFQPFFNRRTKKISFRQRKGSGGAVVQRLVKEIDRARESIKVATGHLRSYLLFDALNRAKDRGVDVQIILDNQEYISEYWQEMENERVGECLQSGGTMISCTQTRIHFGRKAYDAGIDVVFKYYSLVWSFLTSPQMHHKYMIVDDHRVLTGSYNWSNNAEFKTFENVAIVENANLVSEYVNNFEKILKYGEGEYEQTRSQMSRPSERISSTFSPMALRVPEIDELREIACKRCPQLFCSWTLPEGADLEVRPAACPSK